MDERLVLIIGYPIASLLFIYRKMEKNDTSGKLWQKSRFLYEKRNFRWIERTARGH